MAEHIVAGRIARLAIFALSEFGTRASFIVDELGRPVVCAAEGDIAHELIGRYFEGDNVVVKGVYEPRPATATANTPWVTRLRVREVRVSRDDRLAA